MSYKNSGNDLPSDSQEILLILRNPNVHYPIHNIPPPAHIPNLINPFHDPPPFKLATIPDFLMFYLSEEKSCLTLKLTSQLRLVLYWGLHGSLHNAQI